MDPGITEDTVQYKTVRKMKSAFANLYQASVDNASTEVIGGRDGKRKLVMGCTFTTVGMIERRHACIHIYGRQGGAGVWPLKEGSQCLARISGRVIGFSPSGRSE
jgi:hypothetical protein